MAAFKEILVVELTEDVSQDGVVIPCGTHGTVIVAGQTTYLVEIVWENGDTLAEIEVSADQIRPYSPERAKISA